jgi:mono/diheme cytochrome c family protein
MERNLTVVSTLGGLGALLVAMTSAVPSWAVDQPTGKAEYTKYCGACHGPAGKGDGFVATFLRPKPPDLTQLA